MTEFLAAGLDEALFWRCTPKQIAVHFEAAGMRNRRDHDGRAWLAWHVAALSRARKLPRLDALLARTGARRRQTWEEQLAMMQAWSARVNRAAAKRK